MVHRAQKSVPDSAGEWPTFLPPPLESCSGTANVDGPNCSSIPIPIPELELELKLVELEMELKLKTLELELELELKTGIEFFATATAAITS